MMITHNDVVQGGDEWLDLRLGIITASSIQRLMTAKLALSESETSNEYMYELLAEQFTGEPKVTFTNEHMVRGTLDEPLARQSYEERHNTCVTEVGFVTNDFGDGVIGYSPDGLVGDDGLVEFKCRFAKFHIRAMLTGEVPKEHVAQLQAGLLVTGRKWIDFVMRCDGLPDFEKRVYPDAAVHETMIKVAKKLYDNIKINKQKLIGIKT